MKTLIRLSTAGVLFFATIVLGGAGCDSSDGSVGPIDDVALAETGGEGFGDGGGPLAGLAVEQIDARVSLSEAQRAQMGEAIRDLRSAQRERWGHRGRDSRAQGDPPIVMFVETTSKILTPDQFRNFALLVKEQRDSRIAGQMGDRGGRHADGRDRNGFGRRAAATLGLTAEQRAQMKSTFRAHADELRSIRTQTRAGQMTREEARDQIHATRLKMRDEANAILTADQREKAESFRRERMDRQVDQRIAHLDAHLARRAEFLARVLGLDAGQAQQVRALVLGTAPARTEVLNGLRTGAIEPEDTATRIAAIEEALAGEIAGLLNPEQKARWDAVRDLVPMRGR